MQIVVSWRSANYLAWSVTGSVADSPVSLSHFLDRWLLCFMPVDNLLCCQFVLHSVSTKFIGHLNYTVSGSNPLNIVQ